MHDVARWRFLAAFCSTTHNLTGGFLCWRSARSDAKSDEYTEFSRVSGRAGDPGRVGCGQGRAGQRGVARRHPGDVPEHDRAVLALKESLGDERFEELRAEGARLTLDQVLARVLDGDDRMSGPSPELALRPVHEAVERR